MTKKVTLRKLASDLGVAPATVLRALAGHPHVRPELRSRIASHASACGYTRPDRQTGNVAVITENLSFCPYLSRLLTALCLELHERGYHCCICGREDMEYLNDYMFDGVISTTWTVGFEKKYPKLHNLPFVSLNSGDNLPDNVYMVSSANGEGVREVLQHLYNAGRRRILFQLTFPVENLGSEERLAAYNAFCAEKDLPGEAEGFLLRVSGNGWDEIFSRIRELKADAFFCTSERDMTGLYHVLKQAGMQIPRNISVVGFSIGEGETYLDPPLSVLRQDFEGLARESVNMLTRLIAGEQNLSSLRLPLKFIPRGSI